MLDRRRCLIVLASAALPGVALADPPKRLKLHVAKWSCGSCAVQTCERLTQLAGVQQLITRIRSKHLFVVFDPKATDAKRIIAEIKAAGYEAKADPEATWPKVPAERAKDRTIHLS